MKTRMIIGPLFLLVISTAVYADTTVPLQIPISGEDAIAVCVGESCSGIGEYVAALYRWLVGFAALLAVLAITWGGVQWLISRGESGKIQEARKIIGNAIIGLAIALLSYLILATIQPDMVAFNPLRVRPISALALELEEVEETVFSSGGGLYRAASMASDPSSWNAILRAAADRYGVDCTLAKAIMIQESSGNPNAISHAGAVGLMQVVSGERIRGRPSQAQLLDPVFNVDWGIRILRGAAAEACNGKRYGRGCDVTPLRGSLAAIDPARIQSDPAYARALEFVFAAYNAGPGHNRYSIEPSCSGLMRWECPKNKKLYKETLPYTERIMENFLELKSKGWGC